MKKKKDEPREKKIKGSIRKRRSIDKELRGGGKEKGTEKELERTMRKRK